MISVFLCRRSQFIRWLWHFD